MPPPAANSSKKARHDIRLCTEAGAEPFDAGSQEDDE